MLLPEFSYHRPGNYDTLFRLTEQLNGLGETYQFIAGGTDVLPSLKRDPATVTKHLIALAGVHAHAQVHQTNDHIEIAAATTLRTLANDPCIREWIPVVAKTARQIASPAIQARATLGGNLLVDNRCVFLNQNAQNRDSHGNCFKANGDACMLVRNATTAAGCRARFVSDMAAVLICLDAQFHLRDRAGKKSIAIRDCYHDSGIQHRTINDDAILVSITIPLPVRRKTAYHKLRIRDTLDFPSLGVALGLEDNGDLTIALTGVDTHPKVFSYAAATFDSPQKMLETAIAEARKGISPLKQDFFPPAYRRAMVDVYVKRLYAQLTENAAIARATNLV